MLDPQERRRKLIARRIKVRQQRAAAKTDAARKRCLDRIFALTHEIERLEAQLPDPLRLRLWTGT
jgi:hypothetical protein